MDGSRRWGFAAAFGTAMVGGAWQVSTRHSVASVGIAPIDLAVLRYGIPALVLLPVAWRARHRLCAVPLRWLVLMLAGAGLPFGWTAISGARFAPASHMGVFMAASVPVFTAVLGRIAFGHRVGTRRTWGLALMTMAVGTLGWNSLMTVGLDTWRGDLLFLGAAAMWAMFNISFGRSGLTAWEGAAFISLGSTAMLAPWLLLNGIPAGFVTAAPTVLATQVLMQGVVAGLVGLWLIAFAVQRLGAITAAAFGALVPALSALGGWWWLGEQIGGVDALAIIAVMTGVLLASGATWPSRRPPVAKPV